MNFKDVQQMWVYKVDTVTDKPVGKTDFNSGCNTCVQFRWDVATQAFVPTSDTWLFSSQNACSSSTLGGPPDRIGVYLRLKHDAFTGLVFHTIYLSEASILTLEPMPLEGGCKPPS